jgi:hypothetical protein
VSACEVAKAQRGVGLGCVVVGDGRISMCAACMDMQLCAEHAGGSGVVLAAYVQPLVQGVSSCACRIPLELYVPYCMLVSYWYASGRISSVYV